MYVNKGFTPAFSREFASREFHSKTNGRLPFVRTVRVPPTIPVVTRISLLIKTSVHKSVHENWKAMNKVQREI